MTNADNMIYVAQCKLQEFVRQDASSIRKSKQRMICENSPHSHCPRMQYRFMAEAAQTCMTMYDFNLLSNDDVAKDWEEGEDSRKGGCAVDYEEWNMIDLEAIGEVSDSSSSFVCVGYNNDLMSSVDELA
jgi:hypothetical protein